MGQWRERLLRDAAIAAMFLAAAPSVLILVAGNHLEFVDHEAMSHTRTAAQLVAVVLAALVLIVAMRCTAESLAVKRAATAMLILLVALGGAKFAGEMHRPVTIKAGQFTWAEYRIWERETGRTGTTLRDEYLPKWASGVTSSVPPGEAKLGAAAELLQSSRSRNRLTLTVATQASTQLSYGQLYYPGWRAHVDNEPVAVSPDPEGLISLYIPAGHHEVVIDFGDTPDRRIAKLVSVCSILLGVILLLCGHRSRRKGLLQQGSESH